ncbi:sulfite exporter TauE/SafE family protein [Actinocorallia sp. API 0066]|uniref:sulfite exporter TauE/SafE family protein n=1 Tax=Actinocorallia sp. API 0066 TaxID=2896846 RepID=UPI001E656CB9|nr:sulfite exporter TauE/SafE family protein [Actinocorallia sp. API 0066]MCD0450597.1 sulfite exporter TauE/SafE family protein [Actinocorallia sp. API 0066]
MTPWEAAAILVAGAGAGGINAVVGSGSLITFPTLVALGYPPVVANVSNNIGLVPGSITGTWGYRRELAGRSGLLLRLGSASLVGAVMGALLLLWLPEKAFRMIVPALIAIALVLVVVQPKLNRWVAKRRKTEAAHGGALLWGLVCLAGVYGGYFGAAQGILLISLLGIFLADDMQTVNGLKNGLSGIVNAAAAVIFIAIAEVDWWAVLLIGIGATLGGYLGASVGRKLPTWALRGVIVCVGLTAIAKLLLG